MAPQRDRTDTPPALDGLVVAVTATRERRKLVGGLRRRGATVVEVPLVRYLSMADDARLHTAIRRCTTAQVDYVVVTTAEGWRGWLRAADELRLIAALQPVLSTAHILARGPRAAAAVLASGLRVAWSPPSERLDELRAWLLDCDLASRRVAVVEAGTPSADLSAALRAGGAEVIDVPVYRCAAPVSRAPIHRLTRMVLRRETNAVVFTSASGLNHLLDAVGEVRRQAILAAFAVDTVAACTGPACARTLTDLGVPAVWPERGRLDSIVDLVTDELVTRNRRQFTIGGTRLTLQGRRVFADGWARTLAPAPAALLRALADRPRDTLTRAELRHSAFLTARVGPLAVDTAVSQLRSTLGPYGRLVCTAPGHGYRLAVDPPEREVGLGPTPTQPVVQGLRPTPSSDRCSPT